MASLNDHHKVLTDGEGKCSVPMWINGCPAGFCDEPAYGGYIPGKEFKNGHTGKPHRFDGKFNGYVAGLACPRHSGPPAPYEEEDMTKIVGRSLEILKGAHPDLQDVIHKASDIFDMSVLCSIRTRQDQERAYKSGKSELQWPNSQHNLKPNQQYSHAVDVVPYFKDGTFRTDWEDGIAFGRMYGVIECVAKQLNVIELRWGGDWDSDGRTKDETFKDLGHIEILRWLDY